MNHLDFRRQFLLGDNHPARLEGWYRRELAGGLRLTSHPDLPVASIRRGDTELTLLGYWVDPRNPELTDEEILARVLEETSTPLGLLAGCRGLTGRWALVLLSPDHRIVVHDPAGMRSVHFVTAGAGAFWCGSEPTLIAAVAGQGPNPHRQELDSSGAFTPPHNYFWPGSESAREGIARLLPNHYLDIPARRATRFWPVRPIEPVAPETAVARCRDILRGSLDAASRRYNLGLAVTAGLDSRILLAAARDLVHDLVFYTEKRPRMTRWTPDMAVPRKMLRDLRLEHRIIPVDRLVSGEVPQAIRRSIDPCHEHSIRYCAALARSSLPTGNWMTINGNVCEIARCFYSKDAITPQMLAGNVGMEACPYAQAMLGRWLEDVSGVAADTGVDIWDLFYWEQKIGGWFGLVRAQFDIVEEVFTPYNCRELLECLLGVPAAARKGPDFLFFRSLIQDLWPELLAYPINPPDHLAKLRWGLIKVKLGLMMRAKRVALKVGVLH